MIKKLFGVLAVMVVAGFVFGGKSEPVAHTPQELARWECSARIKSAAYVPDSVEWVNRTQWPTMQRDGAWHVVATFTARNRLGVEIQGRKACKVVL